MKRSLSVLLALAALMTLLCCEKKAETEQTEHQPTPYEEAVAYIDAGDIESAYYALKKLARQGDSEAEAKLGEFSLGYLCRTDTDKNGKTDVTTNTYSESGELVLSETVYADGTRKTYTCTYTDGRLACESYTYPNGDTLERTYTYDACHRVATLRGQSSGGYFYEYSYEYDSDGRLIFERESDSDGHRSTTEYEHEDGRLMREKHTYALGWVDLYEYSYNKDGQKIRETRTYSGGESDVISFVYDRDGNLAEQTTEYSDGKTEKYSYYYEGGSLLREEHTATDGSSEVYEYTYTDGSLTRTSYTADGEHFEIAYSYDIRKNLVGETHTNSAGDKREVCYFNYTVFLA